MKEKKKTYADSFMIPNLSIKRFDKEQIEYLIMLKFQCFLEHIKNMKYDKIKIIFFVNVEEENKETNK